MSCECDHHCCFAFHGQEGRSSYSSLSDNNVPLPDEYDQISSDLLPFRALPPAELLKRIQLASGKRDTYTIRVNSGSISTSVTFSDADSDSGEGVIEGARMRVDGQVELIKSVVKDIPDLVAVYTVHDAAEGTISWNHRTELIDLVEDGECRSSLLTLLLMFSVARDVSLLGGKRTDFIARSPPEPVRQA